MRESPRNTDGLGGWGDAGMGLGVYTAAEAAWLAGLHSGEVRYIPHHEIDTYRADGWSVIRAGNEERFHPTQKPVEVMKWCIGHYPDTVDTILDPFMGSGTTGVACARAGRPFIGVEIHEPYFDIACRRIEEAYRQADLFVPAPTATRIEQTTLFDDAPGVGAGAG